jgi:hypothetical protein
MSGIRILSIRQPWAHLIVHGPKRIENRPWTTPYRGRFYIHASRTPDPAAMERFAHMLQVEPPMGGIVGVADLVDVVTDSADEWFFGPYGFAMANPRAMPLVPCRGFLGLYRASPAVSAAIQAAEAAPL